jgi:hypothetical protein
MNLFTKDDIRSISACASEYIFLPWLIIEKTDDEKLKEEDSTKLFNLVQSDELFTGMIRGTFNIDPQLSVWAELCKSKMFVYNIKEPIQKAIIQPEEEYIEEVERVLSILRNPSIFEIKYNQSIQDSITFIN